MADGRIEMAADGTPIGAINAAPNSDNDRVDFAPATFDEREVTVGYQSMIAPISCFMYAPPAP